MKPGTLSHELKEALGMPDNAPPPWLINMQVSCLNLICGVTFLYRSYIPLYLSVWFYDQRYGPPPSYPHLKIPGLNAPIPYGASFGYHPGGWGKPPVDEVSSCCCLSGFCVIFLAPLLFSSFVYFFVYVFVIDQQFGRPLYGDVFGIQQRPQLNYEVC